MESRHRAFSVYTRKLPCSDVQNRELKNAVARSRASPCIENSTCAFQCKSMHPRFRASPCNSVQAGLHIQSVQRRARESPNCASPCKSVQAQSSCCNVCKSCLQRCSGVLLVCLVCSHGCRAVILRTTSLFSVWFPCNSVQGAPLPVLASPCN